MARGNRSPTVEILIRDEVTAQLERERARIRAAAGNNELFAGLQAGFAGLESSIKSLAQTIGRDFGIILRLTGASGFLGGGLVAGIDKAMQAVSGLTRAAEDNRYLADQIGLTSAQLSNLTARGQALGMSSEQSKAGVVSLAKAMRELQLQGRDAPIYKALVEAGGASGARVGDQLIAAVKGPGGYEAGIRQFAKLMGGMNGDAQRKLSEIFNLGSIAFRDLYTVNDIPNILELAGPQARHLNVAMASLNISFDNLKTRLGGAVMPAFEKLSETIDKFLQGPGAKLVQQFADWVSTLNIPWDNIAKGLVGAVEALGSIFEWGKKTVGDLEPHSGKVNAWGPILRKLVSAVVPGFVRHLMSLGHALSFLGQQKAVVEKITAAIGGGGGGDTTKPLLPMPQPNQLKPQKQSRADDDQIPAAAQPASFMSGRSGYFIPGYATEQDDANELSEQVKGTEAQVLRLASYISSQALTTDPTGAGGLAGLAGQIRTGTLGRGGGITFRPGVRGGGGGGGRRERGEDGGGGGWTPQTSLDTAGKSGSAFLKAQRASRIAEIENNPEVKRLVMQMLATETYLNGGKGTTATLEALLNRSIMVGNTIMQELNSGFYGPIKHGQAQRRNLGEQEQKYAQDAINNVAGGSNLIHGRTDQGSGNDPNVGGPGRVRVPGTNEVYNFWQGRRGRRDFSHDDSRRFAESQERQVAVGGDAPSSPTAESTPPAQPSPIVWSNQAEIDAIKKEEWEREHLQPGGFTPIPGRGGGRINLNVNVSGRSAKVSSESSGAMDAANVSRDKSDPSGGIAGFSPG